MVLKQFVHIAFLLQVSIFKNLLLDKREDFLIAVFKLSNTTLSDKLLFIVAKSEDSILLAETIVKNYITCSELLTLQYGLKFENFLIPEQSVLSLCTTSFKIKERSVAAMQVGHLAAPLINRGLGGFL